MPVPFPRSTLVALLLLPFLWVAADRTRYRSKIELESGEAGVRLTVNGRSITEPTRVGALKTIAVRPRASFFQTGCESFTLTPDRGPARTLAVPHRFDFSAVKKQLTGDWWVDGRGQPVEVFREKVELSAGFRVDAVFTGRALEAFEILLEGDNTISALFRGGSLNNDIALRQPDGPITAAPLNADLRLDLLHFLEPIAAGLAAAAALVVVFGMAGWLFRNRQTAFSVRLPWGLLASLTLLAGTGLALWFARSVLDARPHFQDDLGYLLRARWLLAGRLTLDIPPHAEHFTIPWTFFVNGRWMSQYTIGWPALLALGEAFRAAWVVGPLCGLGLGFATWRLGSECGGKAVGFAAATLGMISPLGQILAGSLMSHTAAAMWLALFAWLFVRGWRQETGGWRTLALAGLALGAAFMTRPLAAFSVALAAGLYGLAEIHRLRFRARAWSGLAGVIGGGLLGSLPQFIDNWLVTGKPLLFAYSLCKSEGWSLITYPLGLNWADPTLALVPEMAFGWAWPFAAASPVVLGLAFGLAAVPFLAGRATRPDWLMLGICVALPLAYMGYNGGTSLHGYGPRYYADVFFALFVLTARGFQVLGSLGGGGAVPRALAAALFVVLAGSTAFSLPRRLALYRGYNDVDDSVDRILRRQEITRGLVLLPEPAYIMWVRAGPFLPVDVRAPLVFAQLLPNNAALMKAYADRPVYVLDDLEARPYAGP